MVIISPSTPIVEHWTVPKDLYLTDMDECIFDKSVAKILYKHQVKTLSNLVKYLPVKKSFN